MELLLDIFINCMIILNNWYTLVYILKILCFLEQWELYSWPEQFLVARAASD